MLIHKSYLVKLSGGCHPHRLVTYFTNSEEELREAISIDCTSIWGKTVVRTPLS